MLRPTFSTVLCGLLFLFSCRSARAATYTVTHTGDRQSGSLRAALTFANAHPGTTIRFQIPRTDAGFKNGVFSIRLLSPLPEISAERTVIDGSTQTAFSGDTNPDGPEIEIAGGAIQSSDKTYGLVFKAAQGLARGLVVNRFGGSQVLISGAVAKANIVCGCYLGTDVRAFHQSGSAISVIIENGASENVIGGSTPQARNLLNFVSVSGTGTAGNQICGNIIGVNIRDTRALAKGASSGVQISGGAQHNLIGGAKAGQGNQIAGSGDAVALEGVGTDFNRVQGNYIHTTRDGLKPFPDESASSWGIVIRKGACRNLIGGTAKGARNIVAAADSNCITLDGGYNEKVATKDNIIQGNFIGVGADGASTLGSGTGIAIYHYARGNIVGGSTPGAGNVISGLHGTGLVIWGSVAESDANIVQGNLIGTDATGTRLVGNKGCGISIWGSSGNLIGGSTPGAGNVVCGNRGTGIYLTNRYSAGTHDNKIQGNMIGVDVTGRRVLGNGYYGILLEDGEQSESGTHDNLIGGPAPGEGNVIGSSDRHGIMLAGAKTRRNRIEGNWIGTDRTSTLALGNGRAMAPNEYYALGGTGRSLRGGGAGIICLENANQNFIGGSTPGAGNVIAHNFGDGILVEADTSGIMIRGNTIFENTGLAVDLRKEWDEDSTPTGNDWTDADADGGNGLQNYPQLMIREIQRAGESVTMRVSGSIHSAPQVRFGIDLFLNPAKAGKPQGRHFIGALEATSNDQGEASFAIRLTLSARLWDANPMLNATATNLETGNSSELSRFAASWPTDKIIFVGGESGRTSLYAIKPDGSEPQRIMDSGMTGNTRQYAVSADGSTVLITTSAGADPPRVRVWKMQPDGSSRTELTPRYESEAPGISGTGHVIAYIDNRVTKINPRAKWRLYAVRADGTYLIDERNDIAAEGFGISLSYDGGIIIFCNYVSDDKGYELFRVQADGTHLLRLTNASGSDIFPTISPDGKLIAWYARHGDKEGVFLMNSDGTHQRQLTDFGTAPSFSPDGKQIVFHGDDGERQGLFLIDTDGKHLRYVPNTQGAAFPTWLSGAAN
jgi:hypothetical protein